MRGLTRRSTSALVLFTFLASFAVPVQSQALNTFRVAPSTVWGHIYAGPSADTTQNRPAKVAYLEQKSKFVVNYKNFPEWAKRDFQAAVDIWSANFASRRQSQLMRPGVDLHRVEFWEAHAPVTFMQVLMALQIQVFGIHQPLPTLLLEKI